VVQTGRFEKFLEMIFGQSGLALKIAFGSHYILLIRVAGSLVATAIAGYYGDAMRSPLLPLLAALSAFPGALGGALGGCGSATISTRCCVA
jgi:hypothetical protein